MKAITFGLILCFVLSTGIEQEHEGPLKLIEARTCQETLYKYDCTETKCNSDCIKNHGKFAKGSCDAIEDCICRYPC